MAGLGCPYGDETVLRLVLDNEHIESSAGTAIFAGPAHSSIRFLVKHGNNGAYDKK